MSNSESSSPSPYVLLQISDPHFGTELAPVVAALLQLFRQVAPGLVVLSGDITQRARRSQFAAAREFVSQLSAAPVVSIPGNHDIPLLNPFARFLYPYANYSRCFGEELEPEFESDRALVLCVKTTRRRRHKDGEVSDAQIERVAARLQQAKPHQLRIVVTHQPVLAIRPKDMDNLLHNHDAAVRRWTQAGVDVLMGGHIHLPYIRPLNDVWKDLPRSVWAVQAGTALSRRIRDGVPNSVNLIRYPVDTPGQYLVERWDYAAPEERFRCVETFKLTLDRGAS